MRKGYEIIERLIGRKLEAGKIQSFILDNNLVDSINVLYLKFDHWIHITTTDETAVIKIEEDNPKQIVGWESEGCRFEYPLLDIIDKYHTFKDFIDCRLITFSEIVDKEFDDIVCGLKFDFSNGKSIITYSDEEDKTNLNFDGIIPDDLIENTVQHKNKPH